MALKIAEALKKVLGDQIVKALEDAAKETDVFVGSGDFIPKARFDEVNTQSNEYKTKFEATNTELEKLKPLAAGNEKLTQQIADMMTANEKTKQEYESKIAQREKDYILGDELRTVKAKNAKAVIALLDQTKITVKDGKLEGFKEQYDALAKSDPYLFEVSQGPQPKLDRFGNPIVEVVPANGANTAFGIAAKYVGKETLEKAGVKAE